MTIAIIILHNGQSDGIIEHIVMSAFNFVRINCLIWANIVWIFLNEYYFETEKWQYWSTTYNENTQEKKCGIASKVKHVTQIVTLHGVLRAFFV